MKTVFIVVIIVASIAVALIDFVRDVVIELQIRKGMEHKKARKEFRWKKLFSGEYAELFRKKESEEKQQ